MDINNLLTASVNSSASDLHLSAGLAPLVRIDGALHRLDWPVLEQATLAQALHSLMNENQRHLLKTELEVDFAWSAPGLPRFRINIFNQQRGIASTMRIIPAHIATLEQLATPKILSDLSACSNGLVLVTGPTGSGKSTTLAAMVDNINQQQSRHIITIEDPIEYLHESKRCLIHQREIHRDTLSFNNALRAALREDPDVILIGEMRDLETMRLALTAAETGHLVLATLHTTSAAKTINRIVEAFPGSEKATIRTLLSESLRAVISQTLLKKIGGGRIAALEIMLCTPAIRNLIREDKTAQMYSTIQTSASLGMQTLDQHLHDLVSRNLISRAAAREVAVNPTTI